MKEKSKEGKTLKLKAKVSVRAGNVRRYPPKGSGKLKCYFMSAKILKVIKTGRLKANIVGSDVTYRADSKDAVKQYFPREGETLEVKINAYESFVEGVRQVDFQPASKDYAKARINNAKAV